MPTLLSKSKSGFRCIAAVCTLLMSSSVLASEWQLEADDSNIQLYTRVTESSPMKSYRVVTKVKASLSSIVAFLSDEENFPQWMDKVSEVETIREINDKESLVYQVIDAPWPEKDQDSILYSKWSQDPKTLVVTKTIVAEPKYMEPKYNRRRQALYNASWTLTPEAEGLVKVEYSAEVDPGVGEVQAWMEKMLAYEMPFRTLKNFRRADLNGYAGNKYAFIQEPKRSELVMVTE